MLRLYLDVAVLAARRAARSWLAAVSIPIYTLGFVLAASLLMPVLGPLGWLGGMVIGFIGSACVAGYLSLLASSVAGSRIRFADLKNGLRAVWDVVSVFFALWIIKMGVSLVAGAAGSKADAVAGVASLAVAIFFNIIPELIYNGRGRSFALLGQSAKFVTESPFAWFPPNLIFAFVFLWATGALSFSSPGALLLRLAALGSGGIIGFLAGAPRWKIPLLIVFVHYVMVYRGLLFLELSQGSTRMRDFRRQTGT